MFCLELLAEVALQEAFEGLAVAGFVAGHQHVLKSGSSSLRAEVLRFLRRAAGVLLLLAGLACPNYDTNHDACQRVSYDIYDK